MSDTENREVQGEDPPPLPKGVSEAQLHGGPKTPGQISVPVVPPPGGNFTFWSFHPGLAASLYLQIQDGKEDEILAWATSFASSIEGMMRAAKYMRERVPRSGADKAAAERAAIAQQQQPSPHRPRRVPNPATFVPPTGAATPPQPVALGVVPAFAPHVPQAQPVHRPHPGPPAASQGQLDQEAEIARARVRNKEQLADTLTRAERLAAVPQGLAYLKKIVEEAEARQAAVNPPGSPGAAVAVAAGQPGFAPPAPPPPPPPAPPAPPSVVAPEPPHAPNGSPQS